MFTCAPCNKLSLALGLHVPLVGNHCLRTHDSCMCGHGMPDNRMYMNCAACVNVANGGPAEEELHVRALACKKINVNVCVGVCACEGLRKNTTTVSTSTHILA